MAFDEGLIPEKALNIFVFNTNNNVLLPDYQ